MGLGTTTVSELITARVYAWDLAHRTQRIRQLRITPQPTAAIFTFRTVQPTVPVVEIFRSLSGNPALDMKPENLVTSAFDFIDAWLGNLFTQHSARITGLPHSSRFHYRITAGDGTFPAAVVVGTFATCGRNISVTVNDLMIWNDGDPGLKASGELAFGFGFYYDQDMVASRNFSGNIESGEVRDFPLGRGPTFVSGLVPETFTVFVRGNEYDDDDLFRTTLRFPWDPPSLLPDMLENYENDDEVVVEVMQSFDMPQAPGHYSQVLGLKSVPGGIHYWINGRIDIEVVPPSEPPVVPRDIVFDVNDLKSAAAHLESIGSLVGLGGGTGGKDGKGGKTLRFAIGPDNTLYMKRPEAARWEKLDDGAAAAGHDCVCDLTAEVARDDQDRIHILTLRAGLLSHASFSGKGRSDPPRFRSVGEGLQRNPTMVTVEDGTVYVFARNADGALRVAPLTGTDRGRWIELGGNFAGPIAAHATRREIALFGVAPDGQPQGGSWRIGSSRKPDWAMLGRGLGKTRLRHVDVLNQHGQIQLLAMAEDRRLLTLTPSGRSWSGTWKDQGSLDALGFARPAAPAKKAAKSKVNGSARPMPRRRGGEPGATATH
jgi:hypothetical protein